MAIGRLVRRRIAMVATFWGQTTCDEIEDHAKEYFTKI
jgi:hypothetical protein